MTGDARTDRRVIIVGSAHEDLVLRVDALPTAGETVLASEQANGFGGKGANQAIAAARAGAAVTFAGQLGTDASGERILDNFRDNGIDVGWVRQDAIPTGLAVVVVDLEGRNQIVVAAGASSGLDAEAVGAATESARPGDMIVVQCEVPVDAIAAALAAAAATGATGILNLAPYTPLPRAVLANADIVVVNEGEAAALGDGIGLGGAASAATLAAALEAHVIVTRGEAGSVAADPRGRLTEVDAEHVDGVIDTTGAGDVYVGTLAAALSGGDDIAAAMRRASRAAAASVQSHGAQAHEPQPAISD